jgi:hypothetical protein
MRIREVLTDELKKHYKDRWPREFGHKFDHSFMRNERVNDQYEVKNLLKFYDFLDCYCSVYAFREWHDLSEIRKQSAIIDTIVFDLDSEDLRVAFKEGRKLVEYLLSKDTTPRVYFSGRRGFHVYLDFPPIELKNKSEVIKRFGIRIRDELNLKTVDSHVFEVSRLLRAPFSKHSGSGLRCTPIKPDKFIEMDLISLKSFVKHSFSPIEVHESKWALKELRYEDFKLTTNKVLRQIQRRKIKRLKKDKSLAPCIKAILQRLEEGKNLTHFERFTLVTNLANLGWDKERIIALFEERVPDWVRERTEYQVNHIVGNGYKRPKCATLKAEGLCIPSCPRVGRVEA